MDNEVEIQLKELKRRMDSIQTTLDLLYQDRNMLEDIVTRVSQVEQALNLNKQHQTEIQKDLKADIKQSQFSTEDKMDEMKQVIDEKTLIVKSAGEGVIQKIINKVKGDK